MTVTPEQLLRRGDRAAAAAAAERALGGEGDAVAARRVLAWLALQAGERDEAQRHVDEGLDTSPADADLRFMAGCLAELTALAARAASERSSALSQAEEHLRRAAEAEPALLPLGARVLVRLSTVRLLQGRWQGALNGFETALAHPSNQGSEASLGVVECAWCRGEHREALERSKPLLDDRPDAWILAALAAEASGAVEDALALTAEAQQRLPRGFVAPHRRERWDDLQALLLLHERGTGELRGPLGQVVALMLGREEAVPHAASRALHERIVVPLLSRVLLRGRVDQLAVLGQPAAEERLPGIGVAVQRAITSLAGVTEGG